MLKYAVMCPAEEDGAAAGNSIAAYCNQQMVDCIADITPDLQKAEYLADLLNRNQVSLLHFRDVVEDYIAEG